MLNPFFLNGSPSEQGLMQDLINESLRIYGIDVYYIPRQYITERTVIKEVIQSEFNHAYPIEAYVNTYDGYKGQGTILSKFGIQELDDLIITISRERYENYIAPLISNLEDIKLPSRPKEGDLIYFPLGDRLFEIKYVEHEDPFYQLQKNYTYQLTCELFRYEDEVVDTGIDFIDDNTEKEGHIQSLQLIGVGRTATATAYVVDGGVRYVRILNRGHGYTSSPKVAFSAAPAIGVTATGIPNMIDNLVDFCDTNKNNGRVQQVYITNPGQGYATAPKVTFTGGGGKGAAGIASIGNGVVGIITVTDGGSGYTDYPTITFLGSSTVSAAATAVISDSGSISTIYIIDGGLDYTTPPIIEISAPQSIIGTGSYIYNELVTGSVSGTTARVKTWDAVSKLLKVAIVTGNFSKNDIIVGSKSNAQYKLKTVYDDNIEDPANRIENPADPFAENKEIETEADKLLDFSEKNPFGTP